MHFNGGAGNYLVPAPCGDTWDVLAEPNFTKSLAGYRVVALGGEVQLAQPQLAELSQWVREGGVGAPPPGPPVQSIKNPVA